MTTPLGNPADRHDGRPWVRWDTVPFSWLAVTGHRERVELSAWFDADQQRLVLTLVRFDESLHEWEPCWAQLAACDVGPFLAKADVQTFSEFFVESVADMLEGVAAPPRD